MFPGGEAGLPKTEKVSQALAFTTPCWFPSFHFHACACGMHVCACVFMCVGGCICICVAGCACMCRCVCRGQRLMSSSTDLPPCSLRQGSQSNRELIHVAGWPASLLWESQQAAIPPSILYGFWRSKLQFSCLFNNRSNHWANSSALTLSFSTSSLWMQYG